MEKPRARQPRAPTRRPDLDTVYSINPDGSRNMLHPSDVHGRFQSRKNFLWGVLLAIYVGTPWILIGGRPAVHLDIPGRNAFLFGHTFTNQDFYLVFFLVSGLGFSLFVVTALWGRIWCGYVCPQTVFMEGVFRRVERWIEGPRETRIRRNQGPVTGDKVVRKTLKHAIFLVLAFLTAHAFVAYFIPARELVVAVTGPPSNHWAAFLWGVSWTGILYFDYAWFREQTCLIVCPYGRAQSAMHDANTVVIGYDTIRGEPRSKRSAEGGDCIDCFRCVTACPTGIDIRDGLQMECVGCANCIDACDEIMRKVDREPGLIRYDSQRVFAGEERRSLLRPRVFLYAALALVGLVVFTTFAIRRQPFEAHVLRSRGVPYQLTDGQIRNVYRLRIQNKRDEPAVFEVHAASSESPAVEIVVAQPRLYLEPLADTETPIIATLPRDAWSSGFGIAVAVEDSASSRRQLLNAPIPRSLMISWLKHRPWIWLVVLYLAVVAVNVAVVFISRQQPLEWVEKPQPQGHRSAEAPGR